MTNWADPSSTTTSNSTNWYQAGWGYQAFTFRVEPPRLPKPDGFCIHKMLGVACAARREEIRQAYRRLAKIAHPDTGGTGRWMVLLNRLYELAMQ